MNSFGNDGTQTVRKHLVLHGDVQGVGLRYRAYYAAQRARVTGYVRNLYDGTVEMEAEGRAADIDEMLRMIREGRFVDITDIEVKPIPTEGSRSFEIR